MKKALDLIVVRRVFRIALGLIVVVFLALLTAIGFQFSDALTGKVAVTSGAQILTTLNLGALQKMETQMQERLNAPNPTIGRNPFADLPATPSKP